jgi:hypothetical protein
MLSVPFIVLLNATYAECLMPRMLSVKCFLTVMLNVVMVIVVAPRTKL